MLLISCVSIWCSFAIEVNIRFEVEEIGFSIFIDKYSKVFLVLINCSWLIAIIYSFEFTRYHFQDKRTEFFIYLNILLSVVILNACAGNLVTLFVFYCLGIPLTYPLIKIRNTTAAKASAIVFVKQTGIPALLIFLPAIIITKSLCGNLSFGGHPTLAGSHVGTGVAQVLLAMYIIGISKNSVFPFHTWLPKTNSAPAPVSGLIHSVAAVKTGSIALIKIAVYIFGLDFIHRLTSNFITGGWLTYLCGMTALYTAYKALATDDLKARFAYSTVGQLSYIILAILIGTKTGIIAAVLHIVTHAIAKSCLFYVAGFYNSVYGTVSAKVIGRIMPHTKLIAVVIGICGLSITGFPFLAGYYSKDLMLIEEWNSHYYASAVFLVIGSIVNVLYIIGPVKNAFNNKDPEIEPKKVPVSMAIAFIISLLLIVGSNFYTQYIIDFLGT